MALTPLWQGIPEILGCSNPSEYCDKSLEYYKRIVPVGEARTDLIAAEDRRINPDIPIEFYSWKAFQHWFKYSQDDCKTIGQIKRFINDIYDKDQMGLDILFHRTYLNHTINKFVFLGLLYKLKGEKNDIYYFELMIQRMGVEWFRIGNKYMLGAFQPEKGLFDPDKMLGEGKAGEENSC